MAKGGGDFLSSEHCVADAAMGALGQAGSLACCRNSLVGSGDMAICRDDGPGGILALATGRAVGSAHNAIGGAGGVYVGDHAIVVVADGLDIARLDVVDVVGADAGLHSFFGAGGFLANGPLA